MGAGCQITDRS